MKYSQEPHPNPSDQPSNIQHCDHRPRRLYCPAYNEDTARHQDCPPSTQSIRVAGAQRPDEAAPSEEGDDRASARIGICLEEGLFE